MRKIIFAAVAASLMTLASCKNNEGVSNVTYSVPTYSMITNIVDGGEPVIAGTLYKFNFDMMAGTATIGSELPLGSNNNISFVTSSIPYTGGIYTFEGKPYEVIDVKSFKAGSASNQESIIDLECQLTQIAYLPPVINGLPRFEYPVDLRYAVMHYNIGEDYRVRTFWKDMTFRGTTTTSYPDKEGVTKNYTNKEVLYRIVMDIKEKEATVILYNVKLAEEMPMTISNIVLEKLPLAFDANGIKIVASEIVPKIYEGSEATPNPKYKFDTFECDILGDLTNATIRYKVAGMYQGQFTGSYLLKLNKETDNK